MGRLSSATVELLSNSKIHEVTRNINTPLGILSVYGGKAQSYVLRCILNVATEVAEWT